jgi:hypothetical protein
MYFHMLPMVPNNGTIDGAKKRNHRWCQKTEPSMAQKTERSLVSKKESSIVPKARNHRRCQRTEPSMVPKNGTIDGAKKRNHSVDGFVVPFC